MYGRLTFTAEVSTRSIRAHHHGDGDYPAGPLVDDDACFLPRRYFRTEFLRLLRACGVRPSIRYPGSSLRICRVGRSLVSVRDPSMLL